MPVRAVERIKLDVATAFTCGWCGEVKVSKNRYRLEDGRTICNGCYGERTAAGDILKVS